MSKNQVVSKRRILRFLCKIWYISIVSIDNINAGEDMPFQPGTSGNLNGRPRGAVNRQQLFNTFVESHRDALLNKALELALGGNEAMLRLFLERMLPAKPTNEPIQIDLPVGDFNSAHTVSNFGQEALRAVATGEITTAEAVRVASLISAHVKMYELVKLSDEVRALERDQK